jgi:hypothetical protein
LTKINFQTIDLHICGSSHINTQYPNPRPPNPETQQSTILVFGVQYNIYGYAKGGFKHI